MRYGDALPAQKPPFLSIKVNGAAAPESRAFASRARSPIRVFSLARLETEFTCASELVVPAADAGASPCSCAGLEVPKRPRSRRNPNECWFAGLNTGHRGWEKGGLYEKAPNRAALSGRSFYRGKFRVNCYHWRSRSPGSRSAAGYCSARETGRRTSTIFSLWQGRSGVSLGRCFGQRHRSGAVRFACNRFHARNT